MKNIKIFLTFIILFSIITHTVYASDVILTENDDLQSVINNATAGDTIYVSGDHTAVDVYVENLTIKSNGAGVTGFNIWANNVTIDGFKIKYINVQEMVSRCVIVNNIITSNGISITVDSRFNLIRNNSISDCEDGVYISDASSNTIDNNIISHCENGINIIMSNSDSITNNYVHHNINGINLAIEDNDELIHDNHIVNNSCGIKLGQYTSYNYIYNNYFYNIDNTAFIDEDSANEWNTTRSSKSNIIGGNCTYGNYWGCEKELGFSQVTNDTNNDCIADEPYVINDRNIDYGALVVSNVSAPDNTTNTIIPEPVPEPVIEDDNGGSSGGSSHSSGGSVGGSPEPQDNVANRAVVKARISNADTNVIKFSSTNITGIEFNITRSYGRQPVIVEELKNKSILTSGVPPLEIIEYFNIWVASNSMINKDNLKNATIYFKLPNDVVKNNTIAVYKYDTKWTIVSFGVMNSDESFTYYKVKTSEYGQFVICKSNLITIKPIIENETEVNETNNTAIQVDEDEKISFWPAALVMVVGGLFSLFGYIIFRKRKDME